MPQEQPSPYSWVILLVLGVIFLLAGVWAYLNPDTQWGVRENWHPAIYGGMGVVAGVGTIVAALRIRSKR
jgi:uncharacterized membrane protein HdeD (DUF308 family)